MSRNGNEPILVRFRPVPKFASKSGSRWVLVTRPGEVADILAQLAGGAVTIECTIPLVVSTPKNIAAKLPRPIWMQTPEVKLLVARHSADLRRTGEGATPPRPSLGSSTNAYEELRQV
jgi:hypothetical protein